MGIPIFKSISTDIDFKVSGSDTIVLDNGGLALHVYFKDDSQKVFKDIENVINWVQVQKLKA